ncbi:hypothetical protein QR680_003659 [Steinernema hermaphroditum]|uniref:Transmembrane protein n=1 Tax=Steinernema hermaphroditum TaxID=289476 RepID=A0AA39LRX2_9BILA|nr:hypothetical protein QR680_003659 [Steinernema hermaphroditum]
MPSWDNAQQTLSLGQWFFWLLIWAHSYALGTMSVQCMEESVISWALLIMSMMATVVTPPVQTPPRGNQTSDDGTASQASPRDDDIAPPSYCKLVTWLVVSIGSVSVGCVAYQFANDGLIWPWALMVGALLGIAIGFFNLFVLMLREGRSPTVDPFPIPMAGIMPVIVNSGPDASFTGIRLSLWIIILGYPILCTTFALLVVPNLWWRTAIILFSWTTFALACRMQSRESPVHSAHEPIDEAPVDLDAALLVNNGAPLRETIV